MELVFSDKLLSRFTDIVTKNQIPGVNNANDFIDDIVNCLSLINPELEIGFQDIFFTNEYDYLEMKTYLGVMREDNSIIGYVSIIPPVVGSRNAYISQQVFAGSNLIINELLDSDYVNLYGKPLYILDICRDSLALSSAFNAYIMEKLGAYYQGLYNDYRKILFNHFKDTKFKYGFSTLKEYEEMYNEIISGSNEYFSVDENRKIVRFLSDKMDGKSSLTNEPYWFVMKAFLAAQLGYKEKYTLDISDISNNVIPNKTIDTFKNYVQKLNNLIPNFKQILMFGAPGTGKSYNVSKIIRSNLGMKNKIDVDTLSNVFRVTVYPDYDYNDFIGTIMPTVEKNGSNTNIIYKFMPGIFTRALEYAYLNPSVGTFLVIEEMSRGNVASIFGDVFQILDRNYYGDSEYFINNDVVINYLRTKGIVNSKLYIPSNLSIVGTLNTSDQNVNVMDTAFKRRFDFIYVSVDPVKNIKTGGFINEFEFKLYDNNNPIDFTWNKLYMTLNRFIVEKLGLNEDKQLGQFFVKFDNYNSYQEKFDAIKNKVLHYLWNDVQNISMNDSFSIFDEDIITFSELYKKFSQEQQIFSQDFMNTYK
ncbi:AAA family ATPase [Anaerococcus sp. AGMB00486]|uniref:AAA family ATPase n=1 Tax=Anaerococcus faecalis TaxID=2742993 RepID=A0ABX2N9F7_9FIRM|nr:AAA family ATPase [Anaerococcus faecalis]NVF11290.1 AAA family ATPase [Anaerococcus faecalis]